MPDTRRLDLEDPMARRQGDRCWHIRAPTLYHVWYVLVNRNGFLREAFQKPGALITTTLKLVVLAVALALVGFARAQPGACPFVFM